MPSDVWTSEEWDREPPERKEASGIPTKQYAAMIGLKVNRTDNAWHHGGYRWSPEIQDAHDKAQALSVEQELAEIREYLIKRGF